MNVDLADVKPSLLNFLVVGAMVMLFLILAKYAMTAYPIPGLADAVFYVTGPSQN